MKSVSTDMLGPHTRTVHRSVNMYLQIQTYTLSPEIPGPRDQSSNRLQAPHIPTPLVCAWLIFTSCAFSDHSSSPQRPRTPAKLKDYP